MTSKRSIATEWPMYILGCDEVGTGALAGDAYVCAFATPSLEWHPPNLRDSKKLSAKAISHIYEQLTFHGDMTYVVEKVTVAQIDKVGMRNALRDSMRVALEAVMDKLGDPYRIIVDGEVSPILGAETYPKADSEYPAVMAAAIIAKHTRDEYMKELSPLYPEYLFHKNVGYGTADHLAALSKYGPCAVHRRSYKPVILADREIPT